MFQYAGQEATDRNGHGTTDWFQIGKVCLVKAMVFPVVRYGLRVEV